MKTLSAREMFKQEELNHGGKSYCTGEQAVRSYGKITKNIAYRIIERTKWIGENSLYNVEILFQKDDTNFDRASYGFWNEQDPRGGIFPGKTYTSAREFLNQFVNNLKTKEDVSKQYVDNLYKCFYNKFNRF